MLRGTSLALALALSLALSVAGPVGSPRAIAADRDIVLAFAGDVHFEEQVKAQGVTGGLSTVPALLADADLAMVNLETALTDGGRPESKTYTFRANPSVVKVLAAAGVDAVTMANNHALDYGRGEGLADLLAARAQGPLDIVGVGSSTADALRPAVYQLRGLRVAVFAVASFWVLADWPATDKRGGLVTWSRHRQRLLTAVKAAAAANDLVVVYAHWGLEYQKCPNQSQLSVAKELARAGADVIVGSHPHVVQGVRWVGKSLVAYSLGNFVWYGHSSLASMVLKVRIRDGRVTGFERVPVRYGRDGLPRRVGGATADAVKAGYRAADKCSG